MRSMQYRMVNQPMYDENGQRLWIPILAGAAIISAPFWIGLGRNNNCCGYYYPQQPYYQQQPYYPQQQYYTQPYYYPTQPTVAENNYYFS